MLFGFLHTCLKGSVVAYDLEEKVQIFSEHKSPHSHISSSATSPAASCFAPYNVTENAAFQFTKTVIFYSSVACQMQCPPPVINAFLHAPIHLTNLCSFFKVPDQISCK